MPVWRWQRPVRTPAALPPALCPLLVDLLDLLGLLDLLDLRSPARSLLLLRLFWLFSGSFQALFRLFSALLADFYPPGVRDSDRLELASTDSTWAGW